MLRPVTVWPWPIVPEWLWQTWNSSNFTRPVSSILRPGLFSFRRRSGERGPASQDRTDILLWRTIILKPTSQPRDVVARAIDLEMKTHGLSHVMLDIHHRDADYLRQRFPVISQRCLELGIDLTRGAYPRGAGGALSVWGALWLISTR